MNVKYISRSGGVWDHSPYWQYLESVRGRMPEHLFEFASDPRNHNLDDPNGLHDAWLEYWRISELPKLEGRNKDRRLQIEACFLGPRHDRHIHLTYGDVQQYAVQNTGELGMAPRRTPFIGPRIDDGA